MRSDGFNRSVERGLESFRGLWASVKIPCQGVLVLGFCLGMDRYLSHSIALPIVAGPALGPRSRKSNEPYRRRLRRSVFGSHLTKQDRRDIRQADLARQAALRPTPSVLLRAKSAQPEEALRLPGSSAPRPLEQISIAVIKVILLPSADRVEASPPAPRAQGTGTRAISDLARSRGHLPIGFVEFHARSADHLAPRRMSCE